MPPRYQGDAVPNEDGGHNDDELVDRLRVKKRGDDLATAHQPDIPARLLSKTAHEWADCIVHELDAWRGVSGRRMTGENDAPTLRVELCPHSQAHLVGLPAKHLRVHRPHEGVHAIETFWCRAGRQPFEITVGTRDITVRAGPDVDDDFATLRHESDLPCRHPRATPTPRSSPTLLNPQIRTGVRGVWRCVTAIGAATANPAIPPTNAPRRSSAKSHCSFVSTRTAATTPRTPPTRAPPNSPGFPAPLPRADPITAPRPASAQVAMNTGMGFMRVPRRAKAGRGRNPPPPRRRPSTPKN